MWGMISYPCPILTRRGREKMAVMFQTAFATSFPLTDVIVL